MFLLVRHPSYDVSTGHLDELGIRQTDKLAQMIEASEFVFKRIITSPLPRTREMTERLVKHLGVMWQEDASLAVGGKPARYLPPQDLATLVLVSHAPILNPLVQAWSSYLQTDTPPPLEVGQAYLVDTKKRSITLFGVQPS